MTNEKVFSATAVHHFDTGHIIDYNNVTVLDNARNDFELLIKERLHIQKLKPSLNGNDGGLHLNLW